MRCYGNALIIPQEVNNAVASEDNRWKEFKSIIYCSGDRLSSKFIGSLA